MAKITPQIICDILQHCMGLEKDQIWIYNQRREIPEDKRLYVVVGLMGMRAYGSTNNIESIENGGLTDNLSQYMQENISIDLFSYTTECVQRYHEAIGSLKSTYSQRAQEINALKIASIPSSINDVSQIEGATLLNRISISLMVLRKYDMILDAEYIDEIQEASIDEIEA
jgi:hypothetical protein